MRTRKLEQRQFLLEWCTTTTRTLNHAEFFFHTGLSGVQLRMFMYMLAAFTLFVLNGFAEVSFGVPPSPRALPNST